MQEQDRKSVGKMSSQGLQQAHDWTLNSSDSAKRAMSLY